MEHSRTDAAINGLIGFIMKHELQPGDKLPTEMQLTELLGVGRSTLREATRTLAMRNILEIRQGSGIFVSPKRGVPEDPLGLTFLPNDARLSRELFDIRLLLEPQAAAWAAAHATPEQVAELEELCEEIRRRIEAEESYYEADEAFHSCIARCSGNQVLANLIPIVVSSIYLTTLSSADRFRHSTTAQHRRILTAIRRHDAVGAAMAMSEHLNINREFFADQQEEEQGEGKA